jgi:hypothetical protein
MSFFDGVSLLGCYRMPLMATRYWILSRVMPAKIGAFIVKIAYFDQIYVKKTNKKPELTWLARNDDPTHRGLNTILKIGANAS